MRVIALGIVLMAASAAHAQAPEDMRWHTAIPGRSVQYGAPDTDYRLLRIDCVAPGKIQIMGATSDDPERGSRTQVMLSGVGGSERLTGGFTHLGDGDNFVVAVRSDGIALSTLLSNRSIRVTNGGATYAVPGEGAAKELRPLLEACRD